MGHGGHSSAPASGAVASTGGGIKCVGVEDAAGDIDQFADLYCYLQEHELMRWRNILVEEGITFDRLQYLVLQEGALKEIGIGPTAVRFSCRLRHATDTTVCLPFACRLHVPDRSVFGLQRDKMMETVPIYSAKARQDAEEQANQNR